MQAFGLCVFMKQKVVLLELRYPKVNTTRLNDPII